MKRLLNSFLKNISYFRRNTYSIGYPSIFNIELTNHCVMNCIMCPRKNMARKIGFMDFNLFKKIIDQVNGCSKIICLHHFGESLLHPDFKEFIRYANKKRVVTEISANPIFLTEKINKAIIESKLPYLHISLDGTNQESLQKIRGKNANYKKSVQNIKTLLELKKRLNLKRPYIRIAMIRMKDTEKDIEKFKKQWKIKGVDEVDIKQFSTWDGSDRGIIKLADKEQLSKPFLSRRSYACMFPWISVTMLWDGRVVPCCYDYDGKYVLGDLKENSLKKIWNNEQITELRKQHITKNFKSNRLCATCKEKRGYPPSKLYPFSPVTFRQIKEMI